jgi:hypothetical protein
MQSRRKSTIKLSSRRVATVTLIFSVQIRGKNSDLEYNGPDSAPPNIPDDIEDL